MSVRHSQLAPTRRLAEQPSLEQLRKKSRLGQTALHFTAARQSGLTGRDRALFAAMLIDHGARLDLRDDLLKSTPLGWACRWGHKELVELLIQRGAPVREEDAEAWATPQAWAQKMGHHEIQAILADFG